MPLECGRVAAEDVEGADALLLGTTGVDASVCVGLSKALGTALCATSAAGGVADDSE